MKNQIEIVKNKKVRQSNDFIESPYAQEFSAHEIKIFEIAVASCNLDDILLVKNKNNKEYKFSTIEIAKLLHTSSSLVSQEAKRIANSIMKKYISLKKTLPDKSIEFENIGIMPYAKYKDGVFEFHINYKIIPLFIDINKNFTEYQLHHLLSMKSSYAIKLYKLLYQYKNFKNRIFLVEELKAQFGIIGKYTQYTDFKKRIINPSITQINTLTNLTVTYKEIKFGRKVEKIEFNFEVNKLELIAVVQNSNAKSVEHVTPVLNDIYELLKPIEPELSAPTKKLVLQYYKEKGIDYVEVSIKYTKAHATKNFDKYLCDTLTKGWAEAQIKKTISSKNREQKKLIKVQQEQEKRQREQQQVQLNKSMIEHEWHKLQDIDKVHYINYSNYIIDKYNIKLSSFTAIEETLPMCIYAISNEKTYNYSLEGYIENVLNISLNVYKARTETLS